MIKPIKGVMRPASDFISAAIVAALAQLASAGALDQVNAFVITLTRSIRVIGNSLVVVMFVYGGAKYVYSADDPGARKQAMGICVAAIVAGIIIQAAEMIINQIP